MGVPTTRPSLWPPLQHLFEFLPAPFWFVLALLCAAAAVFSFLKGLPPAPKDQALFRALVEDSSEALLLLDKDRKVIFASNSLLRVSGYTPEERLGGYSGTVILPEDLPIAVAAMQEALASPGQPIGFSVRVIHKAGHIIWTQATLRNCLDDPAIRAIVLNYKDVTAEQSLRKNDARFRALIETSAEATLLMDGHYRILNYYGAVESILGYKAEERIGRDTESRVHPDDMAIFKGLIAKARAQPGSHHRGEYRAQAKDGSWQWLDSTFVDRLDDQTIRAIVVTHHNITPRKEAEEARQQAERQLLRFERLAAIGQTAAGLAHEVRNPLAVISARAEFLKMQLSTEPSHLVDLESILRQCERLNHLVSEVLERANTADLLLTDAAPKDLLQRGLKAAQARFGPASERVTVAQDLAEGLPTVNMDIAQMERVLTNLILNALQALPAGGTLSLGAQLKEGSLSLWVADNGPGIPEALRAKIFEPFFTTKSTGSGLGLWICKSIVEQHGGRIDAETLPQGSRFVVQLPLKTPPSA
jgi:PAS domain S-box-containing protein